MTTTADAGALGPAEVRAAYAAYSRRDLTTLASLLADDVSWPDGEHRLHGREAVVEFWRAQWQRVRTTDVPAVIATLAPGLSAVRIDQTVRDVSGALLSQGRFVHVLQSAAGVIRRLDIVDLPPTSVILRETAAGPDVGIDDTT